MPEHLRATERGLEVITRFYEVARYCARHGSNRRECLQRVLQAATDMAGADAGSLHIFSGPSDAPQFVACQLEPAAAALLQTPQAAEAAALAAASLQDTPLHAAHFDDTPDTRPAHRPLFGILREAGLQSLATLPLRSRTGELLGVLSMFYPHDRQPGETDLGVLRLLAHQAGDYLERQSFHQAVAESEERLRLFLGATSEVVYCMGPDWREVRQLQGRGFIPDVHEPTESWLDQFIPRQDHPAVKQAIREAVEKKSIFEMEHAVIRLDGTLGWVHSRAIPMLDAQGEVVEWFGAASDITARKLAEQALRDSQQRYHTLFDSIDEGYCVIRMEFDAQGKCHDYVFLEINQAFERHTGIQDAVGRSMRSIAPEHEDWWFEVYGEIAKTGQSRRFELPAEALKRHYDVYAFRIGAPEERQVAVLFNDVTERRRFETELRESNRRKDEFLAILAHELRNPLAPVRSGLQVLQLSQDPATLASLLPMLQRQVDHMARLVDDLLEVSRISSGKVELQPEPVELSTSLHGAVETCRPLLDARQHRLVLDLPGQALRVQADPVRLSQVISNLLNNAAKYTDQGGRIGLRAERDGDDALIVVEDNGRGIDEEMLPRIFELFTQAPQTSSMAQGGIGIGLTLVRSLIEMQGGTVEARSAGLGQGSAFTVRLPLLLGSAPAPAAPPTPPAPAAGSGIAPRRVLVVDDNVDAAEGLRMLLTLLGMEVRAAHDGASGLAAAAEFMPDLVLLDIGMPDMDGYELARRLRAAHGAQCPALAAVSGWGQPEDRQRSRDAGIDAHLVKPVGLEQLQELLGTVRAA